MALHAAARSGDVTALMQLVASGQDLDEKDKLSRTALHLAAWSGQTEILRLLLAHGCTASATAMDDMSALHFAAQKGHTDAVRHLLNAGLHVNSRTRKGATALALAAQNGHVETVKLLLQRKANPAAANHKGQTALQLTQNEEVRELLQAAAPEAGTTPAATDAGGGGGTGASGAGQPKKLRGAQKGGRVDLASNPDTRAGSGAAGKDLEGASTTAEGSTAEAVEVEDRGAAGVIGPVEAPGAGTGAEERPQATGTGSGEGVVAAADGAEKGLKEGHTEAGEADPREPALAEPPSKKRKVVLSFGDDD